MVNLKKIYIYLVFISLCLSNETEYVIPLHTGFNLVSFYALPEDYSLDNILYPISETISCISSGTSSGYYKNGIWSGSLIDMNLYSGYWINMNANGELIINGEGIDINRTYNIAEGNNLISFPAPDVVSVDLGMLNDSEHNIHSIIGEGVAAKFIDNKWIGSLKQFEGTRGYWVNSTREFNFNFHIDTTHSSNRKQNPYIAEMVPERFLHEPSAKQAFYFIDGISLSEFTIEKGDWIISYCNDNITGARVWLEETVDIPVFGDDGRLSTKDYCIQNDIPEFKLFKTKTGTLISLDSKTPPWKPNGIFYLGKLNEKQVIPKFIQLQKIYPNPFNPVTNIDYSVVDNGYISLIIYDLLGQEIAVLQDGFQNMGLHTLEWDASTFPSGGYYIQLTAGDVQSTKKLMLVK